MKKSDRTNFDAVDCFWGNGATANPPSVDIARFWNWEKAQTGNTHPGACMPFGWISALPYSGGYSSGYGIIGASSCDEPPYISDRKGALGISHFHTSGVGFMGYFYNYMLITPSIKGSDLSTHSLLTNENPHPGYYAATLQDYGVDFETVCGKFAALHRFKFHADSGRITIDSRNIGLKCPAQKAYFEKVCMLNFKMVTPNHWRGFLMANGVMLYFSWRFTANIAAYSLYNGKLTLDINGDTAESLVAFSLVSDAEAEQRAEEALKAGFEQVKTTAENAWKKLIDSIRADFNSADEQEIFYSCLYHSLVKPGDSGNEYIDFHTMWDIYRTQLPLMLEIAPENASDMLHSILKTIGKFGFFPNGYQMCSDYHKHDMQATGLILYTLCDGFFRGLFTAADYPAWKKAVKTELAFGDISNKSHTHKLDLAGALNAVAIVAAQQGDTAFADEMLMKSNVWRKAYDAKTGLLKSDGPYYEGTYWNYSFRPHVNMAQRIALAGGTEGFTRLLDEFFTFTGEYNLAGDRPHNPDHFEGMNNESDMETPYAYIWAGRSDRLAEVLDLIRRCRFTTGDGGCPGNNDSGGLSSWYVWCCLGIYPLTGTKYYLLGSPSVNSAEIDFKGGTLKIEVERESDKAIYPAGYEFNGKAFAEPWLPLDKIEAGGTLKFILRDHPQGNSPIPDWL